jgi:Tfp pilus assembly protein PilZ
MEIINPQKMNWQEEHHDLADALIRTSVKAQEVVLWQVLNGRRMMVKALVHHVFVDQGLIVLTIPAELKGFKSQLEFYVKLADRDTLFSTNMFKRQKDKLFLSFPSRYRIKENREADRRLFSADEKVKIIMEKTDEGILGQSQFEFTLVDISRSGLGAHIGLAKYDSLRCVDSLKLINIQNKPIKPFIAAKVINLFEHGNGLEKRLKIGVQFDREMKQELIDGLY